MPDSGSVDPRDYGWRGRVSTADTPQQLDDEIARTVAAIRDLAEKYPDLHEHYLTLGRSLRESVLTMVPDTSPADVERALYASWARISALLIVAQVPEHVVAAVGNIVGYATAAPGRAAIGGGG